MTTISHALSKHLSHPWDQHCRMVAGCHHQNVQARGASHPRRMPWKKKLVEEFDAQTQSFCIQTYFSNEVAPRNTPCPEDHSKFLQLLLCEIMLAALYLACCHVLPWSVGEFSWIMRVVHMAKYCNNWTWFCTVTTRYMTSVCCLSICSCKTCPVILWTWLSGISNIPELLTFPAVYLEASCHGRMDGSFAMPLPGKKSVVNPFGLMTSG